MGNSWRSHWELVVNHGEPMGNSRSFHGNPIEHSRRKPMRHLWRASHGMPYEDFPFYGNPMDGPWVYGSWEAHEMLIGVPINRPCGMKESWELHATPMRFPRTVYEVVMVCSWGRHTYIEKSQKCQTPTRDGQHSSEPQNRSLDRT